MTEFAYQRADHMLPEPVALLDPSGRGGHVRNIETLCRSVLNRTCATAWPRIEPDDYTESLGTLIAECFVQQQVYREQLADGRPRYEHVTIAFGPWLQNRLWERLIDFWRSFYGRHGQKRVYSPPAAQGDDGDPGDDRLGGVADTDTSLASLDWAATGGGLLAGGDRLDIGDDVRAGRRAHHRLQAAASPASQNGHRLVVGQGTGED